jgi:hypothetical protein
MKNLSEEEIKADRKRAIEKVKNIYGDDVEIIDNYNNKYQKPLVCLAKSIELLAAADIAYFCKGWNKARGCRIEYMCANDYGIGAYFEEE